MEQFLSSIIKRRKRPSFEAKPSSAKGKREGGIGSSSSTQQQQ